MRSKRDLIAAAGLWRLVWAAHRRGFHFSALEEAPPVAGRRRRASPAPQQPDVQGRRLRQPQQRPKVAVER